MSTTVRLAGEDMARVEAWAKRLRLSRGSAIRALTLLGLEAEERRDEDSARSAEASAGDDS